MHPRNLLCSSPPRRSQVHEQVAEVPRPADIPKHRTVMQRNVTGEGHIWGQALEVGPVQVDGWGVQPGEGLGSICESLLGRNVLVSKVSGIPDATSTNEKTNTTRA